MSKTNSLALILGVLILSFLVGYLVFAAWQEPSQAPPGCTPGDPGCDAPINVGPFYQEKVGAGIGAASFVDSDNTSWWVDPAGGAGGYSALFSDTVGIGTDTPDPTYKLDVNGTIATPYIKSPFSGDITKDGNIDFYDLRLLVESYACASGQPCWDELIGADNLGNYLYQRDADLDGDGAVDLDDLSDVLINYNKLLTPYIYSPKPGDIDKDGFTNHRDLSYLIMSYGCASGQPCWDERIGADNLANTLYQRDADLNGDGIVGFDDLYDVLSNAEPSYYFQAEGYGTLPAAYFKGASGGTNFTLETVNDAGEPLLLVRNDGNIGIGTDDPQGALDVTSTTGGFIVPRMTTAQRDALTPVNGMIIYDTTTNVFNFYENGAWVTK